MDNQPQISKADQDRLAIADAIISLTEHGAYSKYLRPFLISLAQEGYPKPKDYSNEHKLMLDYTQKCGETEAVKKILDFIESQVAIRDVIVKKMKVVGTEGAL